MNVNLNYFKKRDLILNAEIQSIIRLISNWMAVPLFLVFWFADLALYEKFKFEFLGVRLLIIPICWIINKLIKTSNSYEKSQSIASIYAVVLAALINYIIFRIGDTSTSYYAGLNLIAIGGISFIPFRKKYVFATATGIYLPYFSMIAIETLRHGFKKEIVSNIFFILGSIVICCLIRFFNEKLRHSDIQAKNDLENELHSRELVIIKKTEEATKLHQLSAQFSPQIIKAIRAGQISIDENVKSSEICAIFIDIVNSTDRVTKLSEKDMQLSLARFLDTTLSTFLKYDLTIDKFHGDGILAFSNMPIKRNDYMLRTCMAAMEAIQKIKNDSDYYLKHWKSELQVRVGISAGSANVGFYGDKKYFKTFTAIGVPLPYASRLASAAEPNQVLIDKNIANFVQEAGFIVQDLGRKKLKGFDDSADSIYSLVSATAFQVNLTTFNGLSSLSGVNQVCPIHINSILFLDTDSNGHYVFKCRECEGEETSMAA